MRQPKWLTFKSSVQWITSCFFSTPNFVFINLAADYFFPQYQYPIKLIYQVGKWGVPIAKVIYECCWKDGCNNYFKDLDKALFDKASRDAFAYNALGGVASIISTTLHMRTLDNALSMQHQASIAFSALAGTCYDKAQYSRLESVKDRYESFWRIGKLYKKEYEYDFPEQHPSTYP